MKDKISEEKMFIVSPKKNICVFQGPDLKILAMVGRQYHFILLKYFILGFPAAWKRGRRDIRKRAIVVHHLNPKGHFRCVGGKSPQKVHYCM